MKNYKKEEVIAILERKGAKAKYVPQTQKILYFEIPERVTLGIKLLGMADFLKIPLSRKPRSKEVRRHDEAVTEVRNIAPRRDYGFAFSWHSAGVDDKGNALTPKQVAQNYIEVQKKSKRCRLHIEKISVFPNDAGQERVCLEGGIK